MSEMIDRLVDDLTPVRRRPAGPRLALFLALGAVLALAVTMTVFGPRADYPAAFGLPSFWMKLETMLVLALPLFLLVRRLSAPGRDASAWPWVAGAFALLLVAAGGAQLLMTPEGQRAAVWMGGTWMPCPWRITLVGLPVFGAMIVALRGLAPTSLRGAGAAAGLFAGAVGAAVYSLSCGEVSLAFVATWYLLGVALLGLIGWLTGPRLLRW